MAFWPTGEPPNIVEILKGAAPTASQPEKDRLAAVMRFYAEFAKRFLLAFAVRFEFAKFLGLGSDDRLPDGLLQRTRIKYGVRVGGVEATTDWLDGRTPCSPAPPVNLRTEQRVENVVEHPLLLSFRAGEPNAWPASRHTVPDFSPANRYPKLPGYTVRLFLRRRSIARVCSHSPRWLYQVERYAHGAASAAMAKEPELPAGAAFDVLPNAERVPLVAKKPQPQPETPAWIDAAELPKPLEGWYRYRVRGVDLLGVVGNYVETSVPVRDDLPPCAPGIGALQQPVLSLDKAGQLKIPLALVWNAPEEFQGADAKTFRFAGTWKPRASRSATVLAVVDAASANQSNQPDPLGNVQADVMLGDPNAGDTAIARDVGRTFTGGRLVTPAGEFIILPDEPRAQNTVRVRKSVGRSPPLADAVVHLSDKETLAGFIGHVSRMPPTVLIATLSSLSPLELALSPVGPGASAPKEVATLYLHALGQTFAATLSQSGTWLIASPEQDRNDPREKTLSELRTMGEAAAAAFINGSPVLAFPKHAAEIVVPAPNTFWSGSFELHVTTGDGTSYQPAKDGSGLTGNVSAPRIRNIPVRRPDAPARPVSPERGILWAKPAGLYKEDALYTLTWLAVAGAARYEVERVLEGHFGYPPGSLSDDELVKHAVEQPNLFERRSNHVFANRYTDSLPGRAPTRALYQVRAISMAEVAGEWSEAIGPVRVPDFRIPSPPNFLRASSADTAGRLLDRKLLLEWTQSGPLDDLGFIVEAQKDLEQRDWHIIAQFVPGQLAAVGNARFTAELSGQVPGKNIRLRIVTIRHALDPIDPRGQLRTMIRGRDGNEIVACATGDMRKPANFVAKPLGNRRVELSWSNRDEYRWIEIRRVGPNSFSRVKCHGTDQRYIDVVPAATPGEWKYELRAIGYNRNVRLDEVVVAL